ncbi:LPS exporter LptE [Shewanella oneidensis MR-1]|uniref:LPS-assembly lipoprotein LptE n=1 Tax=Shewanella oneidensis (strain ATCC 700550 / JCM 31522 / CIP 106686 / LMG 19005 / NCIMB 14063 / MR-1) TaxID=211586 RepID=Q8EHP5_SHEON|nr:LPS exporter LptE [Shewanella oneidensis]AAN54243.1 OM lipoprotein component of lipopolysaccharide assembly complex chaperone LptE [Shewanella oneidensis MR-1]MDX5996971.1 LPS exporter LptE [Shewanella oneidensis]MEE2028110.1 LPS-assembly lipoprotein LptE [Shewanella oneidensis]QKG95964.1 LPS exporter LptE [Shewanella oneidensis MR-1]
MLIKRLAFAIMTLVIMTSAGCGFKLQRSYQIPEQLNQLSLSSSDEYSELTRLVRERLRLNNVKIVDAANDVPVLRLITDSLERSTLSLYPTGNVAEYELIYFVEFAVALPGKEAQPFKIEIRRDYLDDPRTALAKSREMELLVKEMRIQAADRILQSMASTEVN